jgi:hypothetical protein
MLARDPALFAPGWLDDRKRIRLSYDQTILITHYWMQTFAKPSAH